MGTGHPAGRGCPNAQELPLLRHVRDYDGLPGLVGLCGPPALRIHDSSRSALRFQRIPASMKPSMSPSKTALVLPTSYSVRRSLTIW